MILTELKGLNNHELWMYIAAKLEQKFSQIILVKLFARASIICFTDNVKIDSTIQTWKTDIQVFCSKSDILGTFKTTCVKVTPNALYRNDKVVLNNGIFGVIISKFMIDVFIDELYDAWTNS